MLNFALREQCDELIPGVTIVLNSSGLAALFEMILMKHFNSQGVHAIEKIKIISQG